MTNYSYDAVPNAVSIVRNAVGDTTEPDVDLQTSASYTFEDAIIEMSGTRITLDLAVPDAPSNLLATPASEQIDLTWDITADIHGSAVVSQTIYRSTSSGIDPTDPLTYDTSFSVASDAISYSDTTTEIFRTYYYIITATNGVGESSASNEDSAMEDYDIGTSFNITFLPTPSTWEDYGIYSTFNS